MSEIIWPERYAPGTTDNYVSNEVIARRLVADLGGQDKFLHVLALAEHRLRTVEPECSRFDQHFTTARVRRLHLVELEHLRAAYPVKADGTRHENGPSSKSSLLWSCAAGERLSDGGTTDMFAFVRT